jgi:hypothetical protein
MRTPTPARRIPTFVSLAFVAACSGTSRQSVDSGPTMADAPPAEGGSSTPTDGRPLSPDALPVLPDSPPPWPDAQPGSGDGKPGPVDTSGAPDANAVPPPSQFAKLCEQRKNDLAAAMCPAGDAECTSGCTYFFSASQGSDSLDGKAPAPSGSSGPWPSLARIQSLKLQAGDVLCVRRGDTFRGGAQLPYGLHAPADRPIVIRPYGPPTAPGPVVSGAKPIPPSWTASSLSPKLMQVSLASTLTRGPAYQRQGTTYTPREKIFQLLVAGRPQRLATFPNPGEGPSVAKGLKLPAGHYSLIDAVPGAGQVRDNELPTTNPLTGTAIDWTGARFYYRQIRWIIDALDVTAFDPSTRTLTVSRAPDCATDNCVGWGFFLIDHLGALDSPGEWYYDDETQVLYFYPPAGLDLSTAAIEASTYTVDAQPPSWATANTLPAPAFTTGLALQSNSGIHVLGMVFQHFSDAGLTARATLSSDSADAPESTTQLRVEGCAFHYTGPTGVDIERWGDIGGTDGNNRITGNAFIGQTSQALILQTTHSEVACNSVDDIGLLEHYPRFGMFGNGQAPSEHGMAVYVTADHIDVLYNRVRRTASAGISFGGADSTIAYNLVRQACYTKSDCGGLHTYSWQDNASGFSVPGIAGSTVMNNIVLESLGSSEGDGRDYDTPMAQGLFLDFGSHDYVVKGNVAALNTSAGILLARNRNVTVDGNWLYANVQDGEWNYPYSQLQMETTYPPTDAQITGNVIAAAAPLQIPMGIRGLTVAQAGTFAHNTYFDPFAYDATSSDHQLTNYLIFVAPDDEATRVGYHLREWSQVARENDATGASFYWQPDQITQELSDNLITNGTFDAGLAGWSTNDWSDSTITADTHPVLGPSLRFDRNGAQGGGIGAFSNAFALEAGQTYQVHLWLAPADGVAVPLPPAINLGNGDRWTYIPCDQVREVSFLVTPPAPQSQAVLEFTPYPLYGDRFWIDDVEVKKVAAQPYDQGTAIRFDEPLPTGVRSFLAYNDTDADQALALGTAAYADLAGGRHTGTVTIPAFGAVVLVPEAWAKNPTK